MKKNAKNISVFDKIINIFAWLSFALALLMALTAIFSSFSDEQNGREVFGTKMLIVSSGSMSKSSISQNEKIHFNAGDVIFIKTKFDKSLLKEGDVITFISFDKESYGKTVTHKIREVKYNVKGELVGYVTYGINTGVNDKTLVLSENIVGIYSGKIPSLGNIFSYMKTPRGYFISILIPSILIIIFFSIKVGKVVGQKRVLIDYDDELKDLNRRVNELEKKIQENTVKETTPTKMPINERTDESAVEDYTVVSETNDGVNKLEIKGIKTPFYKKVLSLSKDVQKYFNAIHNELISYKKVKARLSFKCMSYRMGRTLIAKISVRGKTLTMHLSLDVNSLNKNVHFQRDMSDKKAYKDVPCTVKVKSDRGLKNAISLINLLSSENGLIKNEKFEKINVIELLSLEENKIAIGDLLKDKKMIIAKSKKLSFTEKLDRLNEETKEYFNQISNEFTSYKKVSKRLSFKCLSFRTGRKLLAKISVRGKTLTMHLALNVNDFNHSVYFQKDMSNVKRYQEVPFTVKIKSNRAKNNALKLIKELMTINQLEKNNKKAINF